MDQRGVSLLRNDVLDDALGRVKRREVVQPKRLHRNLDLLCFGDAKRALLFPEVVVRSVQEHAKRQQSHEF